VKLPKFVFLYAAPQMSDNNAEPKNIKPAKEKEPKRRRPMAKKMCAETSGKKDYEIYNPKQMPENVHSKLNDE
jgi:hypothetical protein